MRFPVVHLNGTSAEDLLGELSHAAEAIYAAIGQVCDTAPNARDYYPLGPDAYMRARAEHEARLDRLRAVRDELLEIQENVYQQQQARLRQKARTV